MKSWCLYITAHTMRKQRDTEMLCMLFGCSQLYACFFINFFYLTGLKIEEKKEKRTKENVRERKRTREIEWKKERIYRRGTATSLRSIVQLQYNQSYTIHFLKYSYVNKSCVCVCVCFNFVCVCVRLRVNVNSHTLSVKHFQKSSRNT